MSAATTPRPSRVELWRWAERILRGSGASIRASHRAAPLLHLLTEGDHCSTCIALAGEMWDDLAEPLENGSEAAR
jgi:hypothetical protein